MGVRLCVVVARDLPLYPSMKPVSVFVCEEQGQLHSTDDDPIWHAVV